MAAHRFDIALGGLGLILAAVTLGMTAWYIATVDSVPDHVTADRWILVGAVMLGIVVMAVTSYRYLAWYSPSAQGRVMAAGWIVAALAVPLSLFAWGDDPQMSISLHLSEAAGAVALVGWLAFGLCAAAILMAAREHPAFESQPTGPRAHSSGS